MHLLMVECHFFITIYKKIYYAHLGGPCLSITYESDIKVLLAFHASDPSAAFFHCIKTRFERSVYLIVLVSCWTGMSGSDVVAEAVGGAFAVGVSSWAKASSNYGMVWNWTLVGPVRTGKTAWFWLVFPTLHQDKANNLICCSCLDSLAWLLDLGCHSVITSIICGMRILILLDQC